MVNSLFNSTAKLDALQVLQRLRSYHASAHPADENISFKESLENGQYYSFPIGLSFVASNDQEN